MKALITGVTGCRNRGVEALVTTTIDQLTKRHPDIEIDILTNTPDYDRLRLPQDNINLISSKRAKVSLLKKVCNKAATVYAPAGSDYKLFEQASVVIASGGDLFTSDYPGALQMHLRPLKSALRAGVPVVFLGQSIAFNSDETAVIWLKVARQTKLITVREKISYQYLTQDLGLPEHLVKHIADSAFLLKPLATERVSSLLKSYGISGERPIIAIAPSQGISRYAGVGKTKHIETWHRLIKTILEDFKADILLVPHSQYPGATSDDAIMATELYRGFDYHPNIHFAGADHSASEFKGLIAACDMVIAERMHAAIAGLSSGVCTVVVGYSVKAEGILTDLLGAEKAQACLVPVEAFSDTPTTLGKLIQAWEARKDVSAQLQAALPQIKKEANKSFDLVSEILN